MGHRDAGKIAGATGTIDNERGGFSLSMYIDYDGGSTQGFGGFSLTEKLAKKAAGEIMRTFGVERFEDLNGKRCYALKYFPYWNEYINGIEDAASGRRWMIIDFFKRNAPKTDGIGDPLAERRESIERDIERMKERIEADRQKLKVIEGDYKAWKTT